MGKYIDADKLCKALKELAAPQPLGKQSTILGVVSAIEHIPGADVAPIRHARWKYNSGYHTTLIVDGLVICTACGRSSPRYTGMWYNYCPDCGAKMEEVE